MLRDHKTKKSEERSIKRAEEKAALENAPAFLPGGKYHDGKDSSKDHGYGPGVSGATRSGAWGDGLRGDDSSKGNQNGGGQRGGDNSSGSGDG